MISDQRSSQSLTANYADGAPNNLHCAPSLIFDRIASYDNLLLAFHNAIKNKKIRKRFYKKQFSGYADIVHLRERITNGTYTPRIRAEFDKWCKSSQKMRHITVVELDDLIVQHAIYQVVYPLITNKLIFDSYGCRKMKGTHRAADRCQEFIRRSPKDSYFLQIDIRKYYYNLDHEILKSALLHLIGEQRAVEFIALQFPKTNVGMYVGALISQLMGIVYLNEFDHYCKRVLKIKRYIRFVDDIVCIGLSREECVDKLKQMEWFLKARLNLSLSKAKIYPLKKGVNFTGYRAWRNKRIIRKLSMKRFKRNLRKNKMLSVNAGLAHARNTSSYKGMLKLALDKFPNAIYYKNKT